ncbi:competence protein ComK [Priestia megaterium]|uniref:Competence transcription factor K n=1 Tax=Priestia megaterium (strain DSM 319 / IMG 1521) TaxID=592022 RepID=D5DCP9_PRIM3|nr:competence protein ComK [Priestia megaterium]ADF37998.1 competence transcription factor K [Priestia megaterium DSM 319]MED4217248.1 competence protein ComK [Priestia megaterium]WEZ37245.1 competence protein ComK [Priestia megaterium DSM 319]
MTNDEKYQIGLTTKALIPVNDPIHRTKVLDTAGEYMLSKTCKQLLEEACIQELSTFKGSIAAVRKMFPYKQLTPLVINRSQAIIAFPTSSPNDYSCAWIFASHVHTSHTLATVHSSSMLIHFKDGTFIPVKLSYYSLEKKLARAAVIRNYCLESPVVLA